MLHQPRKISKVAFLPLDELKFSNTTVGLSRAIKRLQKEPELHFVRLVSENGNGVRQNVDIHSIGGKLQVQITMEKPPKTSSKK